MAVLATNLNSWNISGGTASTPAWIYPLNQAAVIIEKEASKLAEYGSITFTGISTVPAAGERPVPRCSPSTLTSTSTRGRTACPAAPSRCTTVRGLMPVISYSTGSTPINAEASSVRSPAPPAYSAGDFLVMTVIGASESGTGVAPETPSGWTRADRCPVPRWGFSGRPPAASPRRTRSRWPRPARRRRGSRRTRRRPSRAAPSRTAAGNVTSWSPVRARRGRRPASWC